MYSFSKEHQRVQNEIVDALARRRAAATEAAQPAAPVAPTPTAADLEFERVRTAALARHAAERVEAAEVDRAVKLILDATAIALAS